jgi:tRNA(fMet)-specific endonuclease VapC
MRYLIDTNICIYIMNKHPVAVIKKFKQFELGEIGISAITVSELQHGVAKGNYRENNQQRLEEFIAPLEILTYDEMAARAYGHIRFELEKCGQPIGPLDLLIAAHALSKDLVLITNNDKEFQRIKKLRVENWTK